MPVQAILRHALAFKNLSLPSSLSLPQLDKLPLSNIMPSFMPSLKAFSKAAWTYSQLAFLSSTGTVFGGSPDTCSSPQTSCQNTSAVVDTCCFNAPGGQLLQVRRHLHPPYPPFFLLTYSHHASRPNSGTPILPPDPSIPGPYMVSGMSIRP